MEGEKVGGKKIEGGREGGREGDVKIFSIWTHLAE